MPLLTNSDLETQLNITLSDTGAELAPVILNAAQKWAETYCGYPFEVASHTEYFSDGGSSFRLATLAPISVGPTLTTFNSLTSAYDAYSGTVRLLSDGTVRSSDVFLDYPEGVKVTYSAGWDSSNFPKDLKQALIELAGQKFLDATSGGQTLKKVTAGSYSEEYVTDAPANDIPDDILEVVNRYRLVRSF